MEIKELYLKLESKIERDLKFLVIQKKEILTIDDVALILNVSTSQIYKLTMMGEIKFYKPHGKKIYFRRSDVDEWVFKDQEINEAKELDDQAEEIFNRIKEAVDL